MTLLADKDERFKNLFGKAAIFILLAVIGIGLVFLWTGIKKGAFTAKSPVYFVADSGQDLSEGMPVKFSGFKIGKLNTLGLDEQGHVQVEVIIETKYLALLRQDAVMSLKKEGVIGDGVLEISRGSENKPVLAVGGKVRFERANGLEQAVVDVKNRIVPILDDVHQTLSDPHGDVRQTLKNLREFSAEMRATRERVDRVLGGVDSVLGSVDSNLDKEVGPLLRSLRQSAANAESLSGKFDRELPSLLKKADSSMESLRMTSEAIKDAVQQAAPQVPGVLGEARDTLGKTREMVGSTQDVVDSLSASWPLKNVVPPPETGPIRMDSHD
ncbi:MAG: MCE family protein [Gallionellaceae bacterium]|nr:MAG: MCE family protein [Gallionellaceae bacterium]